MVFGLAVLVVALVAVVSWTFKLETSLALGLVLVILIGAGA
jgi:hypothetical protein